jgi:hypothetical protein
VSSVFPLWFPEFSSVVVEVFDSALSGFSSSSSSAAGSSAGAGALFVVRGEGAALPHPEEFRCIVSFVTLSPAAHPP